MLCRHLLGILAPPLSGLFCACRFPFSVFFLTGNLVFVMTDLLLELFRHLIQMPVDCF